MGTGKEGCGPSLTRLMQTQTTRLRRMRRGVWPSLCATAGCLLYAAECYVPLQQICQGSPEWPNAVPLPVQQ